MEEISAVFLGPLKVCPASYTAYLDDRQLDLTGTEIEILSFLIENQDRVCSRTELAEVVNRRESTVDILITRLRQKVGCNFIRNVRGRGWIVNPKQLE